MGAKYATGLGLFWKNKIIFSLLPFIVVKFLISSCQAQREVIFCIAQLGAFKEDISTFRVNIYSTPT
jgi:hypothetical protein